MCVGGGAGGKDQIFGAEREIQIPFLCFPSGESPTTLFACLIRGNVHIHPRNMLQLHFMQF